MYVCVCVSSLTKRIRKACLRYSVWFPLRPSGEDRSLLETDSVCTNHSVGVCICVILCVYMYRTLFVSARLPCCPSYPNFTHFHFFLLSHFPLATILHRGFTTRRLSHLHLPEKASSLASFLTEVTAVKHGNENSFALENWFYYPELNKVNTVLWDLSVCSRWGWKYKKQSFSSMFTS